MKTIKVSGPGCANCKQTHGPSAEVARSRDVEIQLEIIEGWL